MPWRELIGHGDVIATLRGGVARDSLPHALLFGGRRGVGKRTAAIALAAARYCTVQGDGDGCGACASCKAVSANTHPDLLVIERAPGKRDIAIAQIRAANEALHKTSRSGRGTIALIDGAERLTEEAQNAFLKTLEEPPLGSTIVLITTGAERLLPTTRSRCATFRFGPLSAAEMDVFAARRGGELARRVPRSLARGSPGLWLELATEPHPAARERMLRYLLEGGSTPFDFAAQWIDLAEFEADEAPEPEVVDAPKDLRVAAEVAVVSDVSEVARRRLLDWLLQTEWAIRDLWLVSRGGVIDGGETGLVHSDYAAAYAAIAPGVTVSALLRTLEAIERARVDVVSNVDRTLLLEVLAIEMARVRGVGAAVSAR